MRDLSEILRAALEKAVLAAAEETERILGARIDEEIPALGDRRVAGHR